MKKPKASKIYDIYELETYLIEEGKFDEKEIQEWFKERFEPSSNGSIEYFFLDEIYDDFYDWDVEVEDEELRPIFPHYYESLEYKIKEFLKSKKFPNDLKFEYWW